MSSKAKLFWSASLLSAVGFASPAIAQQAPAAATSSSEQEDQGVTTADAAQQNEEAEAGEIVVTGVRASIRKALEIKRQSAQVVDAIVAEDIGKLPDNNVVDALQRVTGIQVTNRSGGEATAVTIRGLPDIATRWNGRVIFTASGRQFELQDIPANLVSRIEVYKTRAPEHIETGMAGQIDVFTRRPFDFKGFAFSTAARGIYSEQADKWNPNISALVSNRWDIGGGEVGALLNVSWSRSRYRDQQVIAGAMVPFATPDNPPPGFTPLQRFFSNWTPGLDEGLPMAPGSTLNFNGVAYPYLLARDALIAPDVYGDRKRPAVNAALQWAPNDSSEYTFEFFWDGYRNQVFNALHFTFADWWGTLGPNPASTISLFPDTNVIKTRVVGAPFGFQSGDLTRDSTDSFVYALNGKWDLGDRLRLTSDISFQKSRFKSSFLAMRTTRVPAGIELDFNAEDGIPSWHFLDAGGANADDLLNDPAQWTVGEFYDNAARRRGQAWTWSTDGRYDVDRGILRRLNFGFRYDSRRAADYERLQGGNAGLGRNLASLPEGLQYNTSDFFDGRADVPSSWMTANPFYIARNADEIRTLYNSTNPTLFNYALSDDLSLDRTFKVKERTAAAYVQADLEADVAGRPLQVQGGVRLVNINTDSTFYDRQNAFAANSASTKVKLEVLPSISLRYDLTPNLRARLAYGETIRRPNFGDLNPTLALGDDLTNVGYAVGSGGNPDLQPTRSKNYDAALEWYFARDSAIHATVFRRDIEGLVVPLRRVQIITNSGRNNPSNTFILTQPVNASDGTLKGIELGFSYFPDLPGFLDGLGAQGSATFLKSKQNIPNTNDLGEIIGEMTGPFFLVSKRSYNATLAYERGPVGARVSYVWRSKFLHHNEARLFANPIGVWNLPEKSLDAQLNFNVNKRLAITADATNITDEIGHSYYRFGSAGSPDVSNFGNWLLGRTFALGIRYRFD